MSAHRWFGAACEPRQQGWAFTPLAMLGGTFQTRGPDGCSEEGARLASPGVAPLFSAYSPDPAEGARLQASLICPLAPSCSWWETESLLLSPRGLGRLCLSLKEGGSNGGGGGRGSVC